MSLEKTVILRGDPDIKQGTVKAATTITPGMLVDALGDAGGVVPHPTAAGNAAKTFAIEQDYVGSDLDTDYTGGSIIQYCTADSGDEINTLVAANAAAIAKGDFVMSAGDGTVKKYVAQADTGATALTITPLMIVGRALEAVDNSAGATKARIAIEVV